MTILPMKVPSEVHDFAFLEARLAGRKKGMKVKVDVMRCESNGGAFVTLHSCILYLFPYCSYLATIRNWMQ